MSSATIDQQRDQKALPKKQRSIVKRGILLLALALAVWAAIDLYAPHHTKMREFNADEVGRLEAAMWRSYYQKERFKLYNQLTELLRTQYNLPYVRSNAVAYQASKAAFVFKDGHNRADYEKALPNLINFYTAIHKVSDIDFNVEKAAKLELEWWIIHRERKQHPAGDLERALADLPAELYHIPSERLLEHARLRAEAMTIRDDKAETGGVTEADWQHIEELLKESWRSLYRSVHS